MTLYDFLYDLSKSMTIYDFIWPVWPGMDPELGWGKQFLLLFTKYKANNFQEKHQHNLKTNKLLG